jgi:hypothetical protein
MKRRAIAGTEPVEHKRYITDLDHSSTGFYTALIVLAVPAIPARHIGPIISQVSRCTSLKIHDQQFPVREMT